MQSHAPKSAMKRKREAKASAADPEAPAATRPKTKATPSSTTTSISTKPTSILKTKSALKNTSAPSAVADVAASKPKDKAARNRVKAAAATAAPTPAPAPAAAATTAAADSIVVLGDAPAAIQIVAGSYDRTLHGVVATVIPAGIKFTDTFLFNAHSSAIRCLALSPPSVPVPGQGQKIMLATGSTDERINIYNLSAHAPADASSTGLGASDEERAIMAAVTSRPVMPIAENAKNRELGTLLHHASSVTKLSFPTRSKLLSASEDSTIAVTRTRDWSLLSMIKAPVPKEGMGGGLRRPSGDTAPPGGAPSGVNDFAVHPSMKVMISVSRGERSMRLWNLVTGKKAGVLNFSKELLRDLGEGRFSTGEGRQVVWGRAFGAASDAEGEAGDAEENATDEYAIGFDRNVVVFGMDSLPRCKVLSDTRTKTHDFRYVEVDDDPEAAAADKAGLFSLLTVATEDGRILLCSTRAEDLVAPPASSTTTPTDDKKAPAAAPLPSARLIGQVGGSATGVTGRVKAFKILPVLEKAAGDKKKLQKAWYVVSATSTGMLRVWKITGQELRSAYKNSTAVSATGGPSSTSSNKPSKQLGTLLGAYQTPDRITCLESFVMIPRPDGVEDSDVEDDDDDEEEEDDE
ncbi:Protein mak11 [Sporothrix stenoceras]|uniref:Protein mak11 n=1 Tax=Sporothrix stenoceras TaxID=5173 RepID=A0ABR3ZQV5_9PEZI